MTSRNGFSKRALIGGMSLLAAPALALGRTACLPDALGTHRILKVDTSGGLRVGRKSFPHSLDLAPREVVLTFDDGPDPEVTPRILDLLEPYGARATFFCIGRRAAAHPALMREIRARGHAIGNHSMRHPAWFALLGIAGQRGELASAQAVLAETGPVSGLARAPLGLRSPLSDWVFHGLGLRHVAWTRRGFDTRTRDPLRVLARLTKDLAAGDILLLHDGHAARMGDGRPVVGETLPRLLEAILARGLRPATLAEALAP